MGFIKEVFHRDGRIGPSRCTIRSDSYNSTVAHFLRLFEEAQRDFPALKVEKVDVVHYGGVRYRRTYGIEFEVPQSTVPSTYEIVTDVENRL